MKLHGSRRTGGKANPAGQTSIVTEVDPPGNRVKLKGAGGTDNNTRPAVSAPFLITDYILAERLYPQPPLDEILDALVIISLLALKLKHHQAFVIGRNGSLQDIEIEMILPDQPTHYRMFHQASRKMENHSFRYRH